MDKGYECHITFNRADAEQIEGGPLSIGWKFSKIDGDPVLGQKVYCYLTAHDIDYASMFQKMWATIYAVRDHGIEVVRAKIEHIVYDERSPKHP
jgi:hypothetical protein